MTFVELVDAIHDALRAKRLRHAFGGALAFGIAASPRGTIDIDINVFVPPSEMPAVSTALGSIGFTTNVESAPPGGGIRFHHSTAEYPIDIFPSLDAEYDEIARRVVLHPFGSRERKLPFLSPEDLCVFKLCFGRPKDWVDLAALRSASSLDDAYIERKLIALRGPTMYPRLARFRALP